MNVTTNLPVPELSAGSRDARRYELGLITEEELADMLDVQTSTLYNWRRSGNGPDACILGKTVYYRKVDVLSWIEKKVVVQDRVA